MKDRTDPYNHKERFEKWSKKEELKGFNKTNQRVVLQFIKDMSLGLNVNNKKGSRSATRLNTIRTRLGLIIRELQKRKVSDVRKTTAKQLHSLFDDMRTGKFPNRFGKPYKSTGDYVKVFKTFWHWYQKIQRKKGKEIEDITIDLDTRGPKPRFIYFTQEEFENILKKASYDLKPAISLAFDSGARVTELLNIKVENFSNGFKEVEIKEETSKTFGRKIKLMLCPKQIKEYVKKLSLKPQDFIVRKSPEMLNKELRQLGKKVLKEEQTQFKNLTLYDFRHSSACFWLPRYKSESALKYRFGWKKSDMIHYYTELLGMKDTITQEDMYLDVTKTELEKRLATVENFTKLILKHNYKKIKIPTNIPEDELIKAGIEVRK